MRKKKIKFTPEQQKLIEEIVADGLAIQDRFRPEPLFKETGRGRYESQTVEDIRRAKAKKKLNQ